jgi:hypothetical protein
MGLSTRTQKLQNLYKINWIETDEDKAIDIIVNSIIEKNQNILIDKTNNAIFNK